MHRVGYLMCYDYGTGGICYWVTAQTVEAV